MRWIFVNSVAGTALPGVSHWLASKGSDPKGSAWRGNYSGRWWDKEARGGRGGGEGRRAWWSDWGRDDTGGNADTGPPVLGHTRRSTGGMQLGLLHAQALLGSQRPPLFLANCIQPCIQAIVLGLYQGIVSRSACLPLTWSERQRSKTTQPAAILPLHRRFGRVEWCICSR